METIADRFKVRAWKNNEMLHMPIDNYFGLSRLIEFLSNTDVLMQCTGLKDKTGKLIFEGDIVVNRDISGSGRPREFGPRAVRWYRDLCNYNVSRVGITAEIEIIGNIHENPELLEKQCKQ